MIWLLIFVVVVGYLLAMHKEIIMYFKLLWEKYMIDVNPVISYLKKERRNKYMKKTDKKDGINVDIRSKESAYITIKTLAGKWTIYVDNSTGEYIIESWVE